MRAGTPTAITCGIFSGQPSLRVVWERQPNSGTLQRLFNDREVMIQNGSLLLLEPMATDDRMTFRCNPSNSIFRLRSVGFVQINVLGE